MISTPYAGYILSAYGLAALTTLGLVIRAVMARRSVLKALESYDTQQD
jgi:heme exporter protein CcmD